MRGRRTRRIVLVEQEQGQRDVMADEIAKRRQGYAAGVTCHVGDPRIEVALRRRAARRIPPAPPPGRIRSPAACYVTRRAAPPRPPRPRCSRCSSPKRSACIKHGELVAGSTMPRIVDQQHALRIRQGETERGPDGRRPRRSHRAALAHLVGPAGKVFAYEIEPDIAERAKANLARYPEAEVRLLLRCRGSA